MRKEKSLSVTKRSDGGVDLPLSGKRIESVQFWEIEVRLTFDSPDGIIFLADPFVLISNGLSTWYRSGSRNPDQIAELVKLAGSTIDKAFTTSSGVLRLEFEDARVIEVPPYPEYEGWQVLLNGKLGWMVQSLAGGELFVDN
jgi:hypothetical protein